MQDKVVFKIKFKSFLSIIISKFILNVSKFLFRGGTNFPGKIALKIDNHILSTIAKNYKIILVTGTNGKTTTTSMIYNIILKSGKKVITNNTGANMITGITACFIDNFSFKKYSEDVYAVIETDEANVKFVTEQVNPCIITVTNLFRDQLDRYGEVYTTLSKIIDGIKMSPEAILVLNGDESLLGELPLDNKTVYYGFSVPVNDNKKIDINADAKFCKKCKTEYKYNFVTYNHLGSFYCENCGYKRPALDYAVTEINNMDENGSSISINNKDVFINQSGVYNIYNGLCAFSIAKVLGINEDYITEALKLQQSSFGRQENLNIDNHEVKIILVKNPAGFDQAINTLSLDNRSLNLAFLLNDNYADGRDVSWIWDVDFERISSLDTKSIIISGIRLYDMAVRLKIAGLDETKFNICENFDLILDGIKKCTDGPVYILATYTAMIDFRKYLHSKGYIKKLW